MVNNRTRNKKNKGKKVRRKNTINRKLNNNFKAYYSNLRGIKSKIETLKSIIEERKPDVIGIVETMLDKNDEMQIEGYKVIRSDRDGQGGGLMIAVKRELEHVTVEVNRYESLEQSIWLSIGSKEKIRIGLIYAPQENKIRKDQMKEIYNRIGEEVQKAKLQ